MKDLKDLIEGTNSFIEINIAYNYIIRLNKLKNVVMFNKLKLGVRKVSLNSIVYEINRKYNTNFYCKNDAEFFCLLNEVENYLSYLIKIKVVEKGIKELF